MQIPIYSYIFIFINIYTHFFYYAFFVYGFLVSLTGYYSFGYVSLVGYFFYSFFSSFTSTSASSLSFLILNIPYFADKPAGVLYY